MKNYAFYRALHGRGVKLEALAQETRLSKSQLSMIFNGKRGTYSRKHVVKHLTPAELEMLGWDAAGNLLKKTSSQV